MPNSRPEPTRREMHAKSFTIMAAMVLSVAAVAFFALYRTALTRAAGDLEQLVAAQSVLVERTYTGEAGRTGDSVAARQHVLNDLSAASLEFRDFGETGELVLGEARDGALHFLLPERSNGDRIPAPISLGTQASSQLQRAVRGESGVLRGPDYRGVDVVGAYKYLPALNVGLVAKVDVAELRAPLVRAALVTLGVALLVLLIGSRLHFVVVGPLLAHVLQRTRVLESDLRVADATSERYATLFRSAVDPIIIEDLQGGILEVNAAAARAFGWSAEELVGRSIDSLFPTENPRRLAILRNRAVHGEDIRDERRVGTARDGTSLHFLVALTPLRDEKQAIVALSNIAKDITALQDAQAQLEAHAQELEAEVQRRTAALERELQVAHALAAETRRGHELALIGESLQVRALREQIVARARGLDPLLLGGPIGAGQEAVARSVHERSRRAEGPFLVLDCSQARGGASGANPESAIAGATRALREAADGGTLYLEYVDQLALDVQEELAAFLQDAATAHASGQRPVHDIRVIAYLPGEVVAAVNEGRLHPVLASALGRDRLTVPSLAERREDIAMIAERLLDERGRQLGKPLLSFSDRALERLQAHDWPGNLRELSHVIEGLIRATRGSTVDIEEPLRPAWRSVGGYQLTSLIGSGGMGEVWRAHHALLKRPAAIKLTKRRADSSPQERAMLEARFRREAEVTATLDSPHTVQLFDFGVTDDGEFYYVMELLQGLSFSDLLRIDQGVPAARAIHLVRQACLSLAEAHARGLVHRDIKPDNLFACRWTAEVDFVKVLDFGIVKRVEESAVTEATRAGALIGTPAYIAPEVIAGGEASAASDLYSLGCVLFKLLTGRAVFDVSGGVPAVLAAHYEEIPAAPSTVTSRPIPEALDMLVLQLLAKDPAQRPPTALEVRARLGNVVLKTPWTEADAEAWWATHGKQPARQTREPGALRADS